MRSVFCGIVLTLFFVFTGNVKVAWGTEIFSSCVSESGKSKYWLSLNTQNRNGEIRYKFMQQDIIYKVHLYTVGANFIEGIANFERSNSGETRGNPFKFSLDLKNNEFKELNLTAKCVFR